MKHDEITELLGAYALDAVEADERTLVEDHLVTCARCRAEVQDHREVATFLAHGGTDAPEGLWERIAGSLEEAPPDLRLVPASPRPDTPRAVVAPTSRFPRLAVAALAAAVALVALLGVQVRQQDRRIDELQVALQDPMVPAFQAALDAPTSRLVQLASADGELVLRGAITDQGTGYLKASALPRLAGDRTYQLWGAAGDQLVSLGVLGADPGIVTFRADVYDAFAITEEDAPGVVTSANAPIVVGTTT